MANTKITKVQALNDAVAYLTGEAQAEFSMDEVVEKLMTMASAEATASAKASERRKKKAGEKTQANLDILNGYIEENGEFEGLTGKAFADALEITSPKANAILLAGFKAGILTRDKDKAKDPYAYTVVGE